MIFFLGVFLLSFFSLGAMEKEEGVLVCSVYHGNEPDGVIKEELMTVFERARKVHQEWETSRDEKSFYQNYKKIIKTLPRDQDSKEGNESAITINPFIGAHALVALLPLKRHLCSMSTFCGAIDTKKLDVQKIEDALNSYFEASQTLLTNPLLLQKFQIGLKNDCAAIRCDVLNFCALRVKKYHEQKISCGDAIVPLICASCGSADCVFSMVACSAGNSLVAAVYLLTGLMECATSAMCTLNLHKEDGLRCQQLFITSENFETLKNIKIMINDHYNDHKEFCDKK